MPVEMEHIWKSYGEQSVLADFSLTVKEGEKICLMGASGIGKTTVLSILAGLVKPDAGQISGLRGRKISMVFQEDRLLDWADAFENVALVLNQKNFSSGRKEEKAALRDFLRQEFDAVGLRDYEGKPAAQLSGGMRRRIAIVRAACAKGELFLLDEPFNGLDAGTKEQAAAYLKKRMAGCMMVMVTHDIKEVEQMGARTVLFEKEKAIE